MSPEEQPPLILTVDDEQDINELLKEILELKGHFRTISMLSGKDALDFLKNKESDLPSLILLDIMMEPLDGWDTLDAIKKIDRFKDTPVIMLTAMPLTADTVIDKKRIALIENYIVKPVTFNEITSKVGELLQAKENIRTTVAELLAKGKKKEAQEYERCVKTIQRHRKLIKTLKRCASVTGTENTDKIKKVVLMQQTIIKVCEQKLKRIGQA